MHYILNIISNNIQHLHHFYFFTIWLFEGYLSCNMITWQHDNMSIWTQYNMTTWHYYIIHDNMTMTLATCSTILLLVLLGQSPDSHWQLLVFIWHASQPRQKESISFAQKLTLDVLHLSTIYSQFYWANKSFFTLIISIIHYFMIEHHWIEATCLITICLFVELSI